MKKFKIPCFFGDKKIPFDLYVGENDEERHPLHFQALWLEYERGGQIPREVIDSFQKLSGIAIENKVSFEELCMYALGSATEDKKGEKKVIIEGKEVVLSNYYELDSFRTYNSKERFQNLNRKYCQVFLRRQTDYVRFELKLKNKLFGWMDWEPSIKFSAFLIKDEKEQKDPVFEIELDDTKIPKTEQLARFVSGYGNEKPGTWAAGQYRIKAMLDDKEIAKYNFCVNDFQGKFNNLGSIVSLKAIMFYESAKGDEDMNIFTYQYEAAKTRYLNFRMKLENLWQKSTWYAELRIVVFTELYELKASFNQFVTVHPNTENQEFIIQTGYGSNNPGFWVKGKYIFKFFLFDRLLESETIELV